MGNATWEAFHRTGDPDHQAPLPHAEEMALIEAAIADPAAFAPLYRRYAPRVYGYCLRRLLDRERAADATSQIFVRALGALPRYRPDERNPGATFRAWLFTIANSVVTDAHRRHRSHTPLDTSAGDRASPALKIADAAPSPEERAVVADEIRRLHEMLETLPERQRRVLELRLADLSGAEIAETLGMTVGAVKAAQFRAYTTLRDRFQHDAGRPS